MTSPGPDARRVAVFLGTRPEAVKMAPVVRALQREPGLEPVVVSTGQHRELLRHMVDVLEIPIHRDLDVMREAQSLAHLSARLVEAVDGFLAEEAPAMALVQGDTTSVLMTALACFYRRVPVGHVEAGLRTGDLASPFPEEANRKLAGALADLHFAPTEGARANLLAEGVAPERVLVTGNTVVDALRHEIARQEDESVRAEVDAALDPLLGNGARGTWRERRYVLVTGHRRENFGAGFAAICRALRTLSERFPEHDFVYPVHLNPSVQGPVHESLGGLANVHLVAPQPYRPFVALMRGSLLVLTDSGGVQEEAPSLDKPVLVMRDTTERPEGVAAGAVRLVGAHTERIVEGVTSLLADEAERSRMVGGANPYGDGRAGERIAAAVRDYLERRAPSPPPVAGARPEAATQGDLVPGR